MGATTLAFLVPGLLADGLLRFAGATDDLSRGALSNTFRRGHCAPSALEALLPRGDPLIAPLLELVAGLPGGIANHGAECGGLTAATVHLGLTLGGDKGSSVTRVVTVGRLYAHRFEASHGAIDCRAIRQSFGSCLRAITTTPGLVDRCISECPSESPSRALMEVLAHMRANNFHCAHEVLAALKEVGVVSNLSLRASCGFMGGTLMLGRTCSALTAGVMVIGQRLGAIEDSRLRVLGLLGRMMLGSEDLPDDINRFHRAINAGNKLVAGFIADHGSTACSELMHADLRTDDGCEAYLSGRDKMPICRGLVASVANRVREILRRS